jgi:hypothetical protein
LPQGRNTAATAAARWRIAIVIADDFPASAMARSLLIGSRQIS